MKSSLAELGSVADFVNGAAFKPEDWGDEGSRIIRIQNLTDPSKPYNRTNRPVSEKLNVEPGDLLVSWSASLGVFEWEGPDVAVLNQHIFRVIPDERRVDRRFLRQVLETALSQMRRHLHGATMQHVNRAEFLSTKIYLPSVLEQRRIAEVLDRAEALRAKRRAALDQLDTLTQAIFLDMFGDPLANPKEWKRVPFGDALEQIDSGRSPICLDRPARADEWGVLKLGAVTRCEFDPLENKALPNNAEPDPGLEVHVGDLLFTRKNTHQLVAACALVRDTRPQLLLPDLIFRLRLKRDGEVRASYLQSLLTYPTKRSSVQKLAGGSAGSMPNISKARLEKLAIEVPPMELQIEYERRLDVITTMRCRGRASLGQFDTLFASLQNRAFRGHL